MMWTRASLSRELIVLPGQAHLFEVLTPTSTYRKFIIFKVLFVIFSYKARFCLQMSYPAILFTMLMGFLNRGSFIIHALLPGTSKVGVFSMAFTLSVFLLGAHIHILLPGTEWYVQKGWIGMQIKACPLSPFTFHTHKEWAILPNHSILVIKP